MVLNKMFQTGTTQVPIPYPDIEGDDIQWTTKEEWSPIHSLEFLFNIRKMMDKKTWTKIEDEFRSEIGGTNYNRASWMKHKPRLFELIDQHTKAGSSRAGINLAQEQDEEDDDKIEVEIEPGLIMYVSPKGPKSSRPTNWKSKVQIKQKDNCIASGDMPMSPKANSLKADEETDSNNE